MDSSFFQEITPGVVMFSVASMTGLATLLRSSRKLTGRVVAGAMLYNGLMGLSCGSLWQAYFPEKTVWLPLGVAILIGLSNAVQPDAVLGALLRAFNLRIDREEKKKDDES